MDAKIEEASNEARAACNALLSLDKVPSEAQIASALRSIGSLAALLVEDAPTPKSEAKDGSAASALLSLKGSKTENTQPGKLSQAAQLALGEVPSLAFSILSHEPVFITPGILAIYIKILASVGKPESFPDVFDLYANKPVPLENSSPISYSKANPKKISSAVPELIADIALQSAIDNKNLDTAMGIVETVQSTPAYRRSKFFRQAFPIISGLTLLPVAGYSLARQLAPLQTAMDSTVATNVAFVGFLAYIGLTSTVGFVAITTANDQMDRITWAQGMPLRQRWIREDERAAVDKIAQAWGFKETWRRGEEEGADWAMLKEWTGNRGMWLDRVELMEGME